MDLENKNHSSTQFGRLSFECNKREVSILCRFLASQSQVKSSQVKVQVSPNHWVCLRCLSPILSLKPLRTEILNLQPGDQPYVQGSVIFQQLLYQFIARSTRRLASGPEPGTFCMRGECVTTTPLSRAEHTISGARVLQFKIQWSTITYSRSLISCIKALMQHRPW